MSIEIEDDRAWFFETRSCGQLPEAPLHEVLRWVLEQLHYGCCRLEFDERGDAVTLVLGKDTARKVEEPVVDKAIEYEKNRSWAINFAGIFAAAREKGIESEFVESAEVARLTATENAYMNTDFYYGFELVSILQHIRENTFQFTNVPLSGRLPEQVSRLMGEATRAYLFKLNRSCVSLCRALLESVLENLVDRTVLLQAMLQDRIGPKKGLLQCLIDVGVRALGPDILEKAHQIRLAGNEALHDTEPSDEEAWAVLVDTREVIEKLLSMPREA